MAEKEAYIFVEEIEVFKGEEHAQAGKEAQEKEPFFFSLLIMAGYLQGSIIIDHGADDQQHHVLSFPAHVEIIAGSK
jgi:hypothetical protein